VNDIVNQYAINVDDVLLFAQKRRTLQSLLNTLPPYCSTLGFKGLVA